MPKKNENSKHKSFFKVDNARALKAKKNKAFVKFSKNKNVEVIEELNKNLDAFRKSSKTFLKTQKPDSFVNPLDDSKQKDQQQSSVCDITDAINKL